ncbi:MAG TPA: phage holin family protein [Usitatibacter sp.]|nr:phage holin family protein [Usitatibacter sp.]
MRLLQSAQALLADALALGRTRLELFSTEMQLELARLFFALLAGMAVLLLVVGAVAFAGISLIVSLAPENRAFAAGLIALGFFVLAAAGAYFVRKLAKARARPFDASLKELERDLHALKP